MSWACKKFRQIRKILFANCVIECDSQLATQIDGNRGIDQKRITFGEKNYTD
jgi:hypothetical protein